MASTRDDPMTDGAESVGRDAEARPARSVALVWAALIGVAGSALSIIAGVAVAAATMDQDEGATFIGIWFWLAGPPASAAVTAVVARRRWNLRSFRTHTSVAFAACVLCGLVALSAVRPSSSPSDPDVPPTTSELTTSTVG